VATTTALQAPVPPRGDELELAPEAGFLGNARRFARQSPAGVVALALIALIVVVGIFAPLLAPYDPLLNSFAEVRQTPNAKHLLGTDHLGRDTLSRIIYGTRITLIVAVTAVVLGESLGFAWGVACGYLGGRFDVVSQRIVEVFQSFPTLILAILLMVSLGTGITTVIIVIAITRVAGTTRIVRSVAIALRELAYVEAARSLGAPTWRILLRHIAPQCVATILVLASNSLGGAIFTEASLSFLGLGIPPPNPSWGSMVGGVLAEAFRPPWWLVVFPGLAIILAVMAFTMLGDALRDFLDPRLRGVVE
jgi:ABC-type dipeptide/oligopeptide/nickel transport system permease subunit